MNYLHSCEGTINTKQHDEFFSDLLIIYWGFLALLDSGVKIRQWSRERESLRKAWVRLLYLALQHTRPCSYKEDHILHVSQQYDSLVTQFADKLAWPGQASKEAQNC